MKNHMVYCSATDCIYNDNNKCISSSINIEGPSATSDMQTCCDSFSTKKGVISSIKSSMDCTGETKIRCTSVNCNHNDNYNCTLESIKVDCSCEGCNCGSPKETYCSAFNMK